MFLRATGKVNFFFHPKELLITLRTHPQSNCIIIKISLFLKLLGNHNATNVVVQILPAVVNVKIMITLRFLKNVKIMVLAVALKYFLSSEKSSFYNSLFITSSES